MNKFGLLAFLFILAFDLQGQQLSLFTQYRENAGIINPAALEADFFGFGQNLTFGASYRAQWVGLSNAPTTQTLRGSYFARDMSGVSLLFGGHLINDQTGPTGFTGLYGRIGGVITDDAEYGGLSIGLSVGVVQYRVKASEITLRDPNDILGNDNKTQIFPDVGVGIYYYNSLGRFGTDYFYAGVSIPQVIGLDLTFQDADGEFSTKRVQHFYGMLGMYKFFGDDSFIEPSVWVKYVQNAPISIDANIRYQTASSIWIGAGGSSSKAVHLEAGFLLNGNDAYNNLRIGYGFDYSFNTFGPTAGTTHEVNLTLSIDR